MTYVTGDDKPPNGYDTPLGCPFCLAPNRPVDEGLVVARGRSVFAVLNLYPYNPGHLMVCPYRHVADYTDLNEAETVELAQFTQAAMHVIRTVSGPPGFNLGMNQGHLAGAGIAAHLHQHVVPRWGGDTNFMTIVGHTKTMPQLLADTRTMLAAAWERRDAEIGRAPTRKSTGKATKAPSKPAARVAKAATPATATTRAKATTTAKPSPAKASPAKASPAKASPAKASPAKASPAKAPAHGG
jgi:ATP adenylyltransferase